MSLRNLIPDELAKGFGFVQSKPATAFSPVAVTPDELGDAWVKGRVHLPLQSTWNGRKVGMCDAGPEMTFHFGQLIAHLCKTRNVRAGSIIGSGTVSNKGVEKKGRTDWPNGYSCIAEKRAMETILDGKPSTAFMKYGDTIRIEMKGAMASACLVPLTGCGATRGQGPARSPSGKRWPNRHPCTTRYQRNQRDPRMKTKAAVAGKQASH